MGPSPNAVLPDIHQIASGVDTTVAVLGVLSNRKSARLHTRQAPSSAVDLPAALKDSTLPASVCVAEGPRSALGRRHLPVSVWPEATAIPDCRSARASMPFVICSTGDASLSKRPSQIKPQRPTMAARGKERGSARGSRRNFLAFERSRCATGSLTASPALSRIATIEFILVAKVSR